MQRRTPARLVALVLLALGLGAALRVWFIHAFPQVNGDGLLYGDIAKNWLEHGVYGRTVSTATGTRIAPTLMRLPGYPLFLLLCFRIFGLEHYSAVLSLQVAIDLASCLLAAATAWELCSLPAALVTLFAAALCPFTANYVAAPLTETLSIFCVALGLWALARLVRVPGWGSAFALAFAWSFGTLLRPDGALLPVASVGAVLYARWRSEPGETAALRRRALRLALMAGALSTLPFVVWTARNWHTFRVFEPLAPRYATDPGEFTAPGFQAWTKTWAAEFTSTYEVYWNANSGPIEIRDLPRRAFDSPAQYAETRALLDSYNQGTTLSPEIDAGFAALARERERAHPVRSYLWLPLLRVADMWLRPRTEMLNIELRWWQHRRHWDETDFAIAYGLLNLLYAGAAVWAAVRWRQGRGAVWAAMLGYLLLRSLLLATIEAPEARYTIECFPILCVLAGLAFVRCQPGASTKPG